MSEASGQGDFTHLDATGQARMVDVADKEPTHRRAVAGCWVEMKPEVANSIQGGKVKKGEVLAVARVAGIQAAKRTGELIPLCHPLMLSSVQVELEVQSQGVRVKAMAETFERTGVEMEALVACSVAALTIYDMCKSQDKGMKITNLNLLEKTGGKSGDYVHPDLARYNLE